MRQLKHAKSSLSEGLIVLLWLGLIVIVLGCFQIFLFSKVWGDNLPFALGFLAAEIVVGVLCLYFAFTKIQRNETFVCILDDEIVDCVCPDPQRGDTFKLAVEDIVRIENRRDGDVSRWYLHDRQGNRHWLTDDYRNPVDRFVCRIRQLNPSITESDG